METKCAPHLADLFLCSYEASLIQKVITDEKIKKKPAGTNFNFTFR
jgi:hypothetical protein